MLEILIFAGVAVVIGGSLYLRRKLPWPFEYNGKRYYRYRDGRFLDPQKKPIVDLAMVTVLQSAWTAAEAKETADRQSGGWDLSSD